MDQQAKYPIDSLKMAVAEECGGYKKLAYFGWGLIIAYIVVMIVLVVSGVSMGMKSSTPPAESGSTTGTFKNRFSGSGDGKIAIRSATTASSNPQGLPYEMGY